MGREKLKFKSNKLRFKLKLRFNVIYSGMKGRVGVNTEKLKFKPHMSKN